MWYHNFCQIHNGGEKDNCGKRDLAFIHKFQGSCCTSTHHQSTVWKLRWSHFYKSNFQPVICKWLPRGLIYIIKKSGPTDSKIEMENWFNWKIVSGLQTERNLRTASCVIRVSSLYVVVWGQGTVLIGTLCLW